MATRSERHLSFGWEYPGANWNSWYGIWNDSALISRLNTTLFTVLFFIHIFDLWSTVIVLLNGGREINPIAIWFMNRMGIYAGLVIGKCYVIIISGLIVQAWLNSPAITFALTVVIIIMTEVLMMYNLPMVLFIFGGQ